MNKRERVEKKRVVILWYHCIKGREKENGQYKQWSYVYWYELQGPLVCCIYGLQGAKSITNAQAIGSSIPTSGYIYLQEQ